MRTLHRYTALLAAAAGASLAIVATPAAADISQPLASCTSWSINSNVFTCTTGAPPAGAPTGCSVGLSTTSLPSTGGTVTVTGSCSGTQATSWTWTGGFMANSSGPQGTGSVTSTTTFTGTPYNGSTAGTPVANTVTVQAAGGGGGGGGGNSGGGISCASQGFTATHVLALDWNTPGNSRAFSSSVGGFGANEALVVQFTTGSSQGYGWIGVAEYVDLPVQRTAVLSQSPCDFGPQATYGATPGATSAPVVYYTVGANSTGYYPSLLPNTTYYLNVANRSYGGSNTCSGSCNVVVELSKP